MLEFLKNPKTIKVGLAVLGAVLGSIVTLVVSKGIQDPWFDKVVEEINTPPSEG